MSAGAFITGRFDAPPVLLIHGLGGSHRVWDRVLPRIGPTMRVCAVELSASQSIDDDADVVASLITEPTPVVGHSRGGLVATAIAERHPELVTRLILLAPPWSIESRLSASTPGEKALAIPGVGDLLWAVATTSRQRAAMRSAFGPSVNVPDRFLIDMRARGRRSLVHSSRAINDYLESRPLPERLSAITARVDLVFGQLDARIASPAEALAILPNPSVTVLEGVGHTPPWEAPCTIADLILRA